MLPFPYQGNGRDLPTGPHAHPGLSVATGLTHLCAVLASVYNVVYQYWSVTPTAGVLIAPSAVWITVATVLVYTIWKINPREDGTREPLWPMKPAKA